MHENSTKFLCVFLFFYLWRQRYMFVSRVQMSISRDSISHSVKLRRTGQEMLRVARARRVLKGVKTRSIRSSARLRNENIDLNTIERVSDEVDVCIVGGGPAGLSAAIRLKQLEQEKGKEVRVVVIEKGGEIGEYNWRDYGKSEHLLLRFTHTLWHCCRTSCPERTHSKLER
jgi:hypothetical protein